MQIAISTNGRATKEPAQIVTAVGREKRAPILLVFIGTTMNYAERYMMQWCGADLSGAHFISIDTTAQRDHPAGLRHAPDETYVNLADNPGLQQRLRAALRNPRIRRWITADVTRMSPGAGAGAEPLLARFLLEDGLNRILGLFERVVSKLVGSQRANTAATFRDRRNVLGVNYVEPVQVILVSTTVGGTVSITKLIRLLLEHTFGEHGGEAKFQLVLTLPAVTSRKTPAVAKRRKLTYARLQEMSDLFAGGRHSYELSDDLTLFEQGFPYDAVYLVGEPLEDALDEHVRSVAGFVREIPGSLGKAIMDTVIDSTAHCRSPGPLGQPRFLSRVGMATLQAVPFEVVSFAQAVLGIRATEPSGTDQNQAALDFCRQQRLTSEQLLGTLPAIDVPDSSRISDNAASAFLRNLGVKLSAQRKSQVQAANSQVAARLGAASHEFLLSAKTTAVECGPDAAQQYAQAVRKSLEKLRVSCLDEQALELPTDPPSGASLGERVQGIRSREEALARREIASGVVAALKPLVATVDQIDKKAQKRAAAYSRVRQKSEALWRKMRQPAQHTVLTTDVLKEHIEREGQGCVTALRTACWELPEASGLDTELASIISKYAEAFRPLEQIEEALKIAPEPAEEILERTLAASEPAARLDPLWDVKENISRFLFTTMPTGHPLAAVLERRGRTIKLAASSRVDTEWRFVTIDCGLEIGALQATKEAHDAYASDPDLNFTPFLSKEYVATSRLWMPPADEWFARLTIVVHQCLAKDVVTRKPDGLYFAGVLLGKDYFEASREIRKREDRNPELPSFDEISSSTESLLVDGLSPQQTVDLLEGIAAKLKRRLERFKNRTDRESARERLLHDEELSITKALVKVYTRFTEDLEADEEDWQGGGPNRD